MIDYRRPETRRELFQKFYSFILKYRSHPGGVYYVLPYLAAARGWDEEQRSWAAWINANTQNPVTTLLLMQAGDRPSRADDMLNWFSEHRECLAWDTDRRYHRKKFTAATIEYLNLTLFEFEGAPGYWSRAARRGWTGVWRAATALPTMGRLSAWSYLEYLRILGVGGIPDADTLLLSDLAGSRSHRNGLLLLRGDEDRMMWRFNPWSPTSYTHQEIYGLEQFGEDLLDEARMRNAGHSDVGYLTLESALCTFKSWHVPNRRYTGVYNDMLYDRLRLAESRFGKQFGDIWAARRWALPQWLRMEDMPGDPGAVPSKQNHFLETGRPVVLGLEYPDLISDFDCQVARGEKSIYAGERKWR